MKPKCVMGYKIAFVIVALTLASVGAAAESKEGLLPASGLCVNNGKKPVRRRPGMPLDRYQLPSCEEGQEGISPWIDPVNLGPAVPDRWRIIEVAGIRTNLWDPYNGLNQLKGDLPMWGDDWFYSVIAVSDPIVQPRRFPIPVGGATTSRPGTLDTIGRGETTISSTTLILANVLYNGATVFRPPARDSRELPSRSAVSPRRLRSMASRACNTSCALSGLSDGSLDRRRMISASSGLGQLPLCHVGATGGVLMC